MKNQETPEQLRKREWDEVEKNTLNLEAEKQVKTFAGWQRWWRKSRGKHRPVIDGVRPASQLVNLKCSRCGGDTIAFRDEPEPLCNRCIQMRRRWN